MIVPGDGNRAARIMLVGEAPATTEVRLGKPFQGRAGEELNRLLSAAGIDRDEVYVTNISLEPVIGDKDRHFFSSPGKLSPSYLQGIAQCIQDIKSIRPNVVVPLGNYALYGLTLLQQISRRRGSMYWSQLANVKVIPTLHPAALLRGANSYTEGSDGGMYRMRFPVVWDFDRIKLESEFPELRLTDRTIVIDPVGVHLDAAIAKVTSAPSLTFDIESYGGTRIACIGFGTPDGKYALVLSDDGSAVRRALYKHLLESDQPKVGQNLMYDCTMLDQNGIVARNITFDTMLAAHVLWPDLPKGLDFLTSVYTDIPYYKDEGKVWNELRTEEARQIFFNYNGKDVCATAEIAHKQKEELYERNLQDVMARQMAVFEPLRRATYCGCRIDLVAFGQARDTLDRKSTEAQERLDQLAGESINANSSKQVAELIYGKRKLPKHKKDGRLTTDAKTLLDLAARYDDSALQAIVDKRRIEKLRSNYYNDKILSADRRVRFSYNIVGTKTGRLSSAAPLWGPGMNGQNLPASVRKIFLADAGFELWELDQSQAEAVIVAYLAEDAVFINAFNSGIDVHRLVACYLLDKDPCEWNTIPKDHPMRQLGKKCNHAFSYHMGWKTFMYNVNAEYDKSDSGSIYLEPKTAKEIRERYIASRPALPGYWERVAQELRSTFGLTTPLGRYRRFLDAWSDTMLMDAYSYKPQSTVGDATNIGIAQVYASTDDDICYLFKNGMRLWGQVHDSAVWQVPLGARQYAAKLMQAMEVPLAINGHHVTVAIEGAAGEAWNKKAMDSLGVSRTRVE